MSKQSTDHATFTIERTYDAAPARVFDAWADPEAKATWFGPGEEHTLDFQVGGVEHLSVNAQSGDVYTFDARYQDIVPGRRIVYAYDMHCNEKRISVSLATVELQPAGAGTLLRFTEQGVFLDGLDTPAQREHGTGELMDKLGASLRVAGVA